MDKRREPVAAGSEVKWTAPTTKPEGEAPKILIYGRWCKGCGICVEFCPRKVLRLSESGKAEVVAADRCTRCGLCEMLCPDFAITAPDKKGQSAA
ncbi:MAG: 4Fe-4S dicluster domain-containing protein [Chloroflexota bacterium]